jgi:two-component system response regulator (stage 0 sporulation protein F)
MIYNTKNILVVDDSSTARLHICSILESMGYVTRQAPNGKAALELITEEKPDMIVLDLLMPEMDGTATLKVLKASKLAIPVIIISADIQEDVKEECFNLGASAFINKPFKPQVLIDTVNKNI